MLTQFEMNEKLGEFLHNAMQDVVQDLVFEAATIDYRDLSNKFEDKFGDKPRVFLKKSRTFNSALPKSWFPFLSSIPTIETDDSFREIQPLYNNGDSNDSQSEFSSSEDDEHLNEAHNAWDTASETLILAGMQHETLANYRHRLITEACKLILNTTDVTASSTNRNTPLHFISALPSNTDYHAERNNYLLTLLLLSGADPRKKNNIGFTPLSVVTARVYYAESGQENNRNPPERVPSSSWFSNSRLQQTKTLTDSELYTDKTFKFSQQEINHAFQWESAMPTEQKDTESDLLCGLLAKLSYQSTSDFNKPIKMEIKSETHRQQLKQLCDSSNPPRRIEHYRYDDINVIGEGAMSRVYLAVDEEGRREVALKRIQRDHKNQAVAREIRALCESTHCEQVIHYYEKIEEPDFYFIAVELMEGDLAHLIKDNEELYTQRPMNQLVRDMVKGLDFLHQKTPAPIIHRDLKPGNVLYRTSPKLCLKLADFGLAKDLTGYSSLASTSTHSLAGTRGWMAPELVSRQEKDHTTQSDVFALALVSHFLMSSGRHPYDPKMVNLTQAGPNSLIPHEVERNMVEGKQHIHSSLSVEQENMIQIMLPNDYRRRPPAKALLHHSYLWSNHKKIQFLKAVGGQKEVARFKQHMGSSFATRLSQTDLGRRLLNHPWDKEIPQLYKNMTKACKLKYVTTSAVQLVRFFRNAYAHEEERSPELKAFLMADGFFKKFPGLVLTVREAILCEKWHETNANGDRQTIIRALELE